MKKYLSNVPDRDINCTSGAYLYGSAFADDYLINDPESLPRYGYLVRKLMQHYLGDNYNPHLHGIAHEPFLRHMVKEFIRYKVLYHLPTYDWEWLDHAFRKYFSGWFGHSLYYSQARIDSGLVAIAKCNVPVDTDVMH